MTANRIEEMTALDGVVEKFYPANDDGYDVMTLSIDRKGSTVARVYPVGHPVWSMSYEEKAIQVARDIIADVTLLLGRRNAEPLEIVAHGQ